MAHCFSGSPPVPEAEVAAAGLKGRAEAIGNDLRSRAHPSHCASGDLVAATALTCEALSDGRLRKRGDL